MDRAWTGHERRMGEKDRRKEGGKQMVVADNKGKTGAPAINEGSRGGNVEVIHCT